MQPRRNGPARDDVDPLENEEWARVLDHSGSGVMFALTENRLHLVRLRERPGVANQDVVARVYFGADLSKREIVAEPLGLTRFRDMPNRAQSDIAEVIAEVIKDLPEAYLSFYNRAGNLSLKMHAFELLQGVGPRKAREMVEARGRKGWSDLAALDEACGINSAELLAERMAEEISDKKLEPRLVDLLLRQEE